MMSHACSAQNLLFILRLKLNIGRDFHGVNRNRMIKSSLRIHVFAYVCTLFLIHFASNCPLKGAVCKIQPDFQGTSKNIGGRREYLTAVCCKVVISGNVLLLVELMGLCLDFDPDNSDCVVSFIFFYF